MLGLDAEAMSQDDLITSGLSTVNFGVAGHFELAEGATVKLTPLVTSSVESVLMPADRFQFLADPDGAVERLHAERQGVRRSPRASKGR